jgi:hypothetical protein
MPTLLTYFSNHLRAKRVLFTVRTTILSILILLANVSKAQFAPENHDLAPPKMYSISKKVNLKDIHSWMETEFPEYFAQGTYALESIKHSPLGKHLTFKQIHQGLPVHQAKFKLHINNEGLGYYVQNGFIPLGQFSDNTIPDSGNVWFHHQGKYRRCTYLQIDKYTRQYEFNGVPIHQEESKLHYHLPDTLVWAQVFLVNPLNTAEVEYGGAYQDSADRDVVALNAERKWVQMRVAYENDTFKLKNSRYAIADVFFPSTSETISRTDTFSFTRSQHQFEDVNAWYHINAFSDYVAELGYDSALQDSIAIDAHGQGGSDASSFNYGVYPTELEFGEGGVDDAEDGEVVVHEFGHSLSIKAGGETVFGRERRAMEEGTADYFCASYSRRFTDFAWREIFNWDGHNPFFSGVNTGVSKQYPDDLTGGTNSDRELWSSPLMCIYESLGQKTTDSLVLSHLFFQMANSTMSQMAEVLLMIDSVQFNEANYVAVKGCFVQYGMLDWNATVPSASKVYKGLELINSRGFALGTSPLHIKHIEDIEEIVLHDMAGKVVWQAKPYSKDHLLSPETLSSGSFVMTVVTNSTLEQVKIIKL